MPGDECCGPETAKGDRVVFSNPTAGYPFQQALAIRWLTVGKTYVVRDVTIGSWETLLKFEGVPDMDFNSVLFSPEAATEKQDG